MAFKNTSVLCLLLSFLCIEAAAAIKCEPDCDGKADFDKVVDPSDCRRFYFCIDEKPQPNSISCGFGLSFDNDTMSCVVDLPPYCSSLCGPDGGSGECRLTCDTTINTINDPFNCGIYHKCVLGGLQTMECPEDAPYFDSITDNGTCVTDESVCCVPGCTPHCQTPKTVIPDPLDCAYYYICEDVGKPPEEYRMPCAEGTYFDLPIGECSSRAKCQVLCPSSTSSSQPVTTPTSSDCANSFQCKNTGLFSKCNSCHSQYFKCDEVGKPAVEESCEEGFLFNPVPSFPHCILSSVCPYLPFLK